MSRHSFSYLVILLALLLASPVCATGTIKVGIIDSYTGPASVLTQDVLDGFKMALDKINASGGAAGKKIEYVTRDDKFQPDVGLAMAKELVMRENVDVLMGTINSATALAISEFAKKEKIPFIVTQSKSDKITGEFGHKYVFNLSENTEMAGRAAAIALAKKPFQTYWIAGDDYEYGHDIADAVWNNLQRLKPSVRLLGRTWWKPGESDFLPYLTQISAAHPDFLISASGAASLVNFMKAIKSTGMIKVIPMYAHTATDLSILLALGQDAAEGIYGTCNYHFYYPDSPENRSFVTEFRNRYNRLPKAPAMIGYMAAQVIAGGYKRAGSADKTKFVEALEGLSVDGPTGRVQMRACDHVLLLPMFWGVTKKDSKYDFLVASDIQTIPGKDYIPSCDAALAKRQK